VIRLVAALALLLVPAATAATPAQIATDLSRQRVSNGIPGRVQLEPNWTLGCRHHIRYDELNGISWTHTEEVGKPGYTQDGRLAGAMGDQAYTHSWDAGNPFENLPLHLASLLAPTLQKVGAFESGPRVCIEISLGYTRQYTKNQIFTYPGAGHGGVPTSQTVHGEWPAAPGDVVGLPQGTTHGPTIYVLSAGPWITEQPLHITNAHLRGPSGPVAIRIVDPTVHPKITPYVAAGAFFLIPVSPLTPNTTYTAGATVRSKAGTTITKSWSFRTG
jgi:hypothetical protein